jgi:acetate kinase
MHLQCLIGKLEAGHNACWQAGISYFMLHTQIVAFDTAFPVSSMPPAAFTYALPTQLAKHNGLRR